MQELLVPKKLKRGDTVALISLSGGSAGPLRKIMATKYFPKPEFFEGCILVLESGSPYGNALAGLHEWRAFAAAGGYDKAAELIVNQLNDYEISMLLKVVRDEMHQDDLAIIENVDFSHRTPMTILPMGAM